MVETSVTTVKLSGLIPNTQYALYTTALSSSLPDDFACELLGDSCDSPASSVTTVGESPASETLIAWTDPAFPAFVEAPTIHPIDMVGTCIS